MIIYSKNISPELYENFERKKNHCTNKPRPSSECYLKITRNFPCRLEFLYLRRAHAPVSAGQMSSWSAHPFKFIQEYLSEGNIQTISISIHIRYFLFYRLYKNRLNILYVYKNYRSNI